MAGGAKRDLDGLKHQVDDLMGMLTREGDALASADVKQLDSILDHKRTMLENLLSFAHEELAEDHAGSPEWEQFLEKLSECRKQNLVNGATMSAMSQSRQRALRVLYGQEAGQESYGRDGRTSEGDAPGRDLGEA